MSVPPTSEVDAAMAAYQKASREHREAWERVGRCDADLRRAKEQDAEARKALTSARNRLDSALDADGVANP